MAACRSSGLLLCAALLLAVPARADLLADLAQREARLRGAAVRLLRAAETSLLRVIWYPILLFVAGPAIVMLAVKLVFGI